MIVDIFSMIGFIGLLILIFFGAWTQRWYVSVLIMGGFSAFAVIWFVLGISVPFGLMSSVAWLILMITLGLALLAIGLLLRKRKVDKCNPDKQTCEEF